MGVKVNLAGDLTVTPAEAKKVLCETCNEEMKFDDNGVMVCRHCKPV